MKKKLLLVMMTALLGAAVTGCGTREPEVYATIQPETIESAGEIATESPLETEKPLETEAPMETEMSDFTEAVDLTFADLSKRRFEFSSGAGGWWEEFTIEKDGYFTGRYQDTDMGSNTVYFSAYSGHFTDLIKVDEYTYKMTLSDISYKDTPDTKEDIDGTLYVYTEAYCLGDNDTFTVYLPGTPISNLSESVWIWIEYYNQSDTELTIPIIVDEENEYGIYSHERLSPGEDARVTLANYQESFDYYYQLISETSTTMEWVIYTGRLYELSDECLNYLWNLIRYNVEEEKYQEILTEQREWIKEKEAAANNARDQWEGGSFAPVDYNDTLATMTIERCYVLAEYLQ